MRFGALVGYRGMVREIVAELKRNFNEEFRLVATGGFAKWVLKDLDLPFVVDPTLTLYGTGIVWNVDVYATPFAVTTVSGSGAWRMTASGRT